MQINWGLVLSVISIVIALLSIVWTYFGAILNLKEKIGDIALKFEEALVPIRKEIADLNVRCESRFSILETKMKPFWDAIGNVVIDLVKHPTAFEKDELLDKLKGNKINYEELVKLKDILHYEINEMKTTKDPRTVAWVLVAALVDQRIVEKEEVKVW